VILQELQAEQILHLGAIDLLGPVPMEGLQGFDHRETSGLNPALNPHVPSPLTFPFQ